MLYLAVNVSYKGCMMQEFDNVYQDDLRAASYARLEFPGTYYLAYRDIPTLVTKYVKDGKQAVDFGCGTGRSTRFLQKMGFDAVGVDISENMLKIARESDPKGTYLLIKDGDFSALEAGSYDLVLSAFTFDNIPTAEKKLANFKGIAGLLRQDGVMVNLVSSPDIYVNEWASFSTKDFPENKKAQNGERVKIIMTDVEDKRPVEDILWSDKAYRELYDKAGLELLEMHEPLGREDEPYDWVNETKIAPWVIYVVRK